MATGPESLEIIDLDDVLGLNEDEETWLVNPNVQGDHGSWRKWNMSEDPEVRMKKRSLVEKLDMIAKGSSPSRFTILPSRPSMSSTPLTKTRFDTRTFTRPSPLRNLSYDKETTDLLANLSIHTDDQDEEDWKNNGTFVKRSPYLRRESSDKTEDDRLSSTSENSNHRLNDVGDVQNLARLQEESLRQSLGGLNSTFTKGGLNSTFTKGGLNATFRKVNSTFDASSPTSNATYDVKGSRSSSQDIVDLDLDRLSNTSDSSMSHRLNDLGDVQNLARMQEESLRQAVMINNQRSATVSPSSENSPSTEGCHQDLHSHQRGGGSSGYNQYSSQDSLPDSPYSSQSLDSQPPPQDRLGRSMPNLNKIRGQNKANGGIPQGSRLSRPQIPYGLSSRLHGSDPRMQPPNGGRGQLQPSVPARGATIMSRDSSAGSNSARNASSSSQMRFQSGIRPPTATTRIARPTTGIPRPPGGFGSRLPAPTSGIPKPGSRASSATGARKNSNFY